MACDVPAAIHHLQVRTGRRRPNVNLSKPPCREQIPSEGLRDLKRKKIFQGCERRCCGPRSKVHLADPEDENDERGDEKKDGADSTGTDGKP